MVGAGVVGAGVVGADVVGAGVVGGGETQNNKVNYKSDCNEAAQGKLARMQQGGARRSQRRAAADTMLRGQARAAEYRT
eukprot:3036620-Karenia_brevis.AAC.1